jgi:hypothetical protein
VSPPRSEPRCSQATSGATSDAPWLWYRISTHRSGRRELRHSFVSLLSDAGVPLEQISQLVGHSGTTVTEVAYRQQLRPVIQTGAIVMDQLFSGNCTLFSGNRSQAD